MESSICKGGRLLDRDKAITKYIKDHVSFMGFSKDQEEKIRKKLKTDISYEFDQKNKKPHPMDRPNKRGRVKDRARRYPDV